jgi:hypothetical protein
MKLQLLVLLIVAFLYAFGCDINVESISETPQTFRFTGRYRKNETDFIRQDLEVKFPE